ncbi:Arabinose 5-phosphate isomerase KdsD [compost metagenome]
MHRGGELPLIGLDTQLPDVVAMISAKGFGCAIVMGLDGKLAGVVTDGDLRRKATMAGGDSLRARDIMTANPRRVGLDTLAVEALELVNRVRITALIVVDAEEKPVGLVHVHDLLAMGVA